MEWLNEYRELSSERQVSGNYIGSIPASKIEASGRKFGAEAEAFHYCIRAMDAAWLKMARPKKEGEHRIMSTPLTPSIFKEMSKK